MNPSKVIRGVTVTRANAEETIVFDRGGNHSRMIKDDGISNDLECSANGTESGLKVDEKKGW